MIVVCSEVLSTKLHREKIKPSVGEMNFLSEQELEKKLLSKNWSLASGTLQLNADLWTRKLVDDKTCYCKSSMFR